MSPRRTRPPLDANRITAAAVAIADRDGMGAVSMRSVAKAVGVEAMSLYHHVANKDALIDLMVDAVFGEIAVHDVDWSGSERAAGEPWQDAVHRRSRSVRAALRRHPWATGLLDSRSTPGPATLAHHDAVLGCLRRAGFSIAEAAHAFALLDSFVYGFVLQEAALPFDGPDEIPELATTMLAAIAPGAYPYLVEMATEHVLVAGYDFADEFEIGLATITEALERRRLRTAARS